MEQKLSGGELEAIKRFYSWGEVRYDDDGVLVFARKGERVYSNVTTECIASFRKTAAVGVLIEATKELLEYAEARADWYREEADAFYEVNEWNLESDENLHVEELHKTEAAIRKCIVRAGAAIAAIEK